VVTFESWVSSKFTIRDKIKAKKIVEDAQSGDVSWVEWCNGESLLVFVGTGMCSDIFGMCSDIFRMVASTSQIWSEDGLGSPNWLMVKRWSKVSLADLPLYVWMPYQSHWFTDFFV
jgi:hypothetical protein